MSLSPADISYQKAHFTDDIGYRLNVTISIFGVFALACVTARLFTRRAGRISLGADDYLIVAAMV